MSWTPFPAGCSFSRNTSIWAVTLVCGFVQYFADLQKRNQLAQVFQTYSSQKLLLEQRAEMKGYSPNTPPPHPGDSPLTLIWKRKYLKNLDIAYLFTEKARKKHVMFQQTQWEEGSRPSISGLLKEHQYLFFKWLKGKSRWYKKADLL